MYNLHEAYLDVYESRRNMPGELRPTVMPRSREQNIGKFDDWKYQTPETWEGKTAEEKAASRLRSRASAVVQTQRRQDREVGIRKEELDIILNYLLDEGYVDTEQAAEKIISVMSEEWIDSILNESDSAENEEKERTKNNSTQLSKLRREIQQLTAQGKPVPMDLRKREAELGRQVRLASNANAALKDNPKTETKPAGPQKPKDVVSGLSSPTLRARLTNQATQMINRVPDNPKRPARASTHVTSSGEVRTNISQDTSSGIDDSKYVNQTRSERGRPARQQTPRRGETGSDPNRPITTRNQTN